MIAFLKLIRTQNLLIIAFTQYMVRYCLIAPILKARGFELQLSHLQFFLLSLSTVMIAAAGYIINDYFDLNIDKVNKPERMVIGKGIKRRVAIGAHTVINIIAIIIGLYVSYSIGAWKLVSIHIMCTAGLWFYSTTFKRQFFIGNFIIASFTALVPFVVGVYELLPCYKAYSVDGEIISLKIAWTWVIAISFFAFITTLLREILKDMEDYEGDKAYGCKTMPIVIGIKYSKFIVILLALFTMTILGMVQILQFQTDSYLGFYYFLLALQIPFLCLIFTTYRAQTKKQFRYAGNTAKFIMLMGVCYLFIFAYYILSSINAI